MSVFRALRAVAIPAVVSLVLLGCGSPKEPTVEEKALLEKCAPKHAVKANGIELEYESFGPENAPTLLLVMGLGYQLTHWDDDFVQGFVDRGFRVVRFDNRDAGLSTKFHGHGVPNQTWAMVKLALGMKPTMAYALGDMAEDTVALMDALKIPKAHLFGVSMGGMIAQEVAILHPERVLTLTSAMSSTGEKGLPGPTKAAMGALTLPRPTSHAEAVEHAMQVSRIIGSPEHTLTKEQAEVRVSRTYERCSYPPGFSRQLAAVVGSESREKRLAAVKVPALVVHGKLDPLVPVAAGEATARAIPGAEWMPIDGMGHDLPRAMWPQIIDAVTKLAARASPELASTPQVEATATPVPL